jgi:glycerol uptake facilitator-like aquaporin
MNIPLAGDSVTKDRPRSDSEATDNTMRTTNILDAAMKTEEDHAKKIKKIEKSLVDKVMKDTSPEARRRRRVMALRAGFGEFMCTLIFFVPVFGCLANIKTSTTSVDSPLLSTVVSAFAAGFQAIAVSFAFSSISGAHFNPAISWALWLLGRLSSRRVVIYILAQLLASIIAMSVVASMFHGGNTQVYRACAVIPTNDSYTGEVFATEFFLTFIFTYVAFTVVFEDAESAKKESMSFQTLSDSKGLTLYASTPQSKTGFAPFAIGLTIFSLCLVGGESGGAFNPARLLGPAIFSGEWNLLWLYWIAQLMGSSAAALIVHLSLVYGLSKPKDEAMTVMESVNQVAPDGKLLSSAHEAASRH